MNCPCPGCYVCVRSIMCVCSCVAESLNLHVVFADVDSRAGVGAQWRFLLWLCAALRCVLCDLQPPHQPRGGGNTGDVPASFLHHMCSHYCDGSVTQVHTHTHTLKYTTVNGHTTRMHTKKHTQAGSRFSAAYFEVCTPRLNMSRLLHLEIST